MRRALAAVILLGVTTGTAACGSPRPAAAAAARSPAPPAASSPASSAPPASPSPPPGPWQAWCNGTGYNDLLAVLGEWQAVTTDAANSQYGTAASDGTSLVIDAARSQLDPPPGSPSQVSAYESWMKEAGDIGAAVARYDLATAEYSARQAIRYKWAVQAADGKCTAMGGI